MALDKDEINDRWIPKCEVCNWTGEGDPEQGKAHQQYLNHCRTKEHKDKKKKVEDDDASKTGAGQTPPGEDKKAVEEPKKQEPPKPEPVVNVPKPEPEPKPARKPVMEELSENEILTMYGDEGRRFLKRKKLEQLLSMAPDMSEKIVKWVMENYDQDENAKRDLNALYMLLLNCKVKVEHAGRIVQMVMAAEQKWWNEQNTQANPGGMFFSNTGGQPGGQQGFQVFYDQWGRPVNVPTNNTGFFMNPGQQNTGYPQNLYPQRPVDPAIEDIKKTVADMAKTVSLLANPPQKEVTKTDIAELVVSAVKKATEEPPLTKQDIVQTVINTVTELSDKQKEETHLELMYKELKAMRADMLTIQNRPPNTPAPKSISEEGHIDSKKLDIIGEELKGFHDTVKHGMTLLLSGEEKPETRTGNQITELDKEIDQMAISQGG